MFRPVLWGVAAVFFILSGRAMLTSQSGTRSVNEATQVAIRGRKQYPRKSNLTFGYLPPRCLSLQ